MIVHLYAGGSLSDFLSTWLIAVSLTAAQLRKRKSERVCLGQLNNFSSPPLMHFLTDKPPLHALPPQPILDLRPLRNQSVKRKCN